MYDSAAPVSARPSLKAEIASLWTLAWPILIGQLATVGMSVADVAMTGHDSAAQLAAVSVGAAIWAIVIVTVIGIMMAMNAIVAHEVGADNLGRIPHLVRQSLWKALGVGVAAMAAMNLAVPVFDHIGLDPAVRDTAAAFLRVTSLGMPAFAAYRALYGYSTSLNQTKPIMMIALGGLAWNVLVNWLLIFGQFGLPRLGGVGCAVSTASGMWLMLAAMLVWIRRAEAYQSTYPFDRYEGPHWPEIRSMLRLGLPIGVTYFAEVSAFAIVGLLVARFGVVQVSSHQIALNFASLVFMVPMSIGLALTTRVGQAVGEGDPARARFAGWAGVGVSLAFAVLSALGIVLFRAQIAAAYSTDPAVRALTQQLLLFAALFQLSDAAQVAAACAIRGYKVSRTPMLIQMLAFWVFAIPLGCLLGLAPDWLPAWVPHPGKPMGVYGFWIGLVLGLTVAAVLLLASLKTLARNRLTY